MNETKRPAEPRAAPGDAEYSDGYIQGYAEGLREGLRELFVHASQGHTTSELRVLVKSRIARIPEDVELKRRQLLAPPRRTGWEPLLKAPSPALPGSAPSAGAGLPEWSPGRAFLFREERPRNAVRFAQARASAHARVLWVSLDPPPPLGVEESKVEWVRPGATRPGEEAAEGIAAPGGIAGRIQARGGEGSLLVYLDALEYLRTEYGTELTLRFASWLAQWVGSGGASTVVASVDEATLPEPDRRRLQRSFHILA
ncbi:MAG: DUF835 domain-containing protein [Thermoplasmata archaeon]|nr:DUF835 domain-containing protein [Thermoplasmata archaeon]